MKISTHASGLNRILELSNKYDCGTVTAFRTASLCNAGETYTLRDNKARNKKLEFRLKAAKYGYKKIKGEYVESLGSEDETTVNEDSYFVIDSKGTKNLEKFLIALGKEFEQDTIAFSKKGSTRWYGISTNKCANNPAGHGKIGVKEFWGDLKVGKGEFGWSKTRGKSFTFASVHSVETFGDIKERTPLERISLAKVANQSWEVFRRD